MADVLGDPIGGSKTEFHKVSLERTFHPDAGASLTFNRRRCPMPAWSHFRGFLQSTIGSLRDV